MDMITKPFPMETLVGKALSKRRSEFTLASKCGMQGVDVAGDGKLVRVIDGRPETIRATCEAALKRLQTDVIDLYYLHRWDKQVPIEDSVGALSDLVRAGKDISQGGIAGTSLMLAECSGCGFEIDIDRLPMPPGTSIARWMRAFPSFGFLLSVRLSAAKEVCARFADRGLAAAVIGRATAGSSVDLIQGEARATFWDWRQRPYLGLGPASTGAEVPHA